MNTPKRKTPLFDAVAELSELGYINRTMLDRIIFKLSEWQKDVIQMFKQKDWTGKLTISHIKTPSLSPAIREREDREFNSLLSQNIIFVKEGSTEAHNRYELTPLGILMLYTMENTEGPVKPRSPDDYSGKTIDEIIAAIPKPGPGRVLPPRHILKILNAYKVENERPDDQELIDAVWEAQDDTDPLENHE